MKHLRPFLLTLLTILTSVCCNAKAKYIFYFIGDGMGMGHVNAAETYNRDILKNENPLLMLTFPIGSQVRTFSFDNPITDSAAAGTALSTGNKTINYRVGITPDSTDLQSIAIDFLKNGYEVGIGSTVAGDDATPAAFYGHAADRKMKYLLAQQAISSGYTFLGAPVWKGMRAQDGTLNDWQTRMQKEGNYTIVHSIDEYNNASKADKILMLANKPYGEQVGYTIDSIPGALDIVDLTSVALRHTYKKCVDNGNNGFFLMIEAGNIDWAAHANDAGAVIKEILNFQKAINVAYKFYLEHPDETLIVITADHDTGGMALGRRDNRHPQLSLADYQKISKDRFSDWSRDMLTSGQTLSWEEMKKFLHKNLGFWGVINISQEDENILKNEFETTFERREGKDEKALYNSYNQFASTVFNLLQKRMGIGWTTGSHTGNFVPLYAIGADAMLFTKNMNNTEVPALILKAAGILR